MAEINKEADERLSSRVSEVIEKYDLLRDKMEVDLDAKIERVEQSVPLVEAAEANSATNAQLAANKAAEAAQTLTTFEGKLANGYYKGDKGDKGDKGNTGGQGVPGVQGIQGERGAKGDKGDKGDRGLQGIQGIQGIQGVKGDRGDAGIMRPTAETWKVLNSGSELCKLPAGGTWAYHGAAHKLGNTPIIGVRNGGETLCYSSEAAGFYPLIWRIL